MSSYSGDSLPLCLILNPGNDSSILEKCLFKSVDLQPSPLECSWQWNVSNKYYTCSVGLRCVKSTGEVSERDLELCEAFIVYLEEFCCSDHLALVQAFASKLENSAETKLIATQKFRSEEDRLQLHTWAAKNGRYNEGKNTTKAGLSWVFFGWLTLPPSYHLEL